MRLLVVEDDPKIAAFVAQGLRQAGHAVDHCARGDEAMTQAAVAPYDAAVVDVMLPGLDGIRLVQHWRREGLRMPVLFLSARGSVDDRVRGLQAGGDDYMVKPFAFTELLARIQALLRRSAPTAEATRLACGDIAVDLLTREVTLGNERVELQPREYSLLEYLLRNAGRPVSKTMILEHVWDFAFDPQTNVVDVLVHRLRSKIDPDKTRLHTLRGVGYVLKQAERR
jgi:two-component system, OmpR family, response regulator